MSEGNEWHLGHRLKWFPWLLLVAVGLLKDNVDCHEHSSLSHHLVELSLLGQMTKACSEHLHLKLDSQALSFPTRGKENTESGHQLYRFVCISSIRTVPIVTLHGTVGFYLLTLGHLKKDIFMTSVTFLLECCHAFLQRVGVPGKSK